MDLTIGDIKKVLIKFAIPIIILQILNQAYMLIDSIIVSRYAGGNEFAILSNISTLTMLGYCLIQGGAIASNVIFANLFGSNAHKEIISAKKTFNIVNFIYSVIIFLLYSIFAKQLLSLINIPSYLLEQAVIVLIVYALNFIPTSLIMVNQGVLTGSGDSKTPMILCIIFQILNLILDYIAIAIYNYGVLGAAIASLIAAILSAISTYYLAQKIVKPYYYKCKFSLDWLKKAIKLAIPSTISQSVISLGTFILQIIVNGYGVEIINGYNVGLTLNNVVACPILALCTAYESFGAQNLGAHKIDRVKQGFSTLLKIGLLLCTIALVITYLLKDFCVSLYISDTTSTSYNYAKELFVVMSLNYFVLFLKNSFDSYYKAHQKMNYLAIISIICLSIRIILSFILTNKIGPIFLAYACIISNFVGLLIYIFIVNKPTNNNG